ncbi:MAG: ATP-binding protein [Bacteroidota bacterium]
MIRLKYRFWSVAAFAILLFCCMACGSVDDTERAEHPEYFDTVYAHAQRIHDIKFRGTNDIADSEHIAQSIHYFESALNAFPNPGVIDRYRLLRFKIGCYQIERFDFKHALLLSDSVLALYNDPKNMGLFVKGYALGFMHRGDALHGMGRFAEAYECYYRGHMIAENNNLDGFDLAEYNNRFAKLCYTQHNYRQAMEYWQSTIQGLKNHELQWPEFSRAQEVRDNIGLCYQQLGKNDSATIWFNSALNLIDRYEKQPKMSHIGFLPLARSVIYDNLAECYIREKQYKKADSLVTYALSLLQDSRDWRGETQSCISRLAKINIVSGNLGRAKYLLDSLQLSFPKHPYPALAIRSVKMYADYYLAVADSSRAYSYLQRYYHLHDSLDNEGRKPGNNFTAEFNNIHHRHQLELLSTRDKQKAISLLFAVVVSVIGSGATIVVWKSRRKLRGSLDDLTILNNRISEQNLAMQDTLSALQISQAENNRLLRIVAHDLRNPVGAISSAAELLEADLANMSTDCKELLAMIKTSANDSLGLIQDLLQFRNDKVPQAIEQIDLAELLAYGTEQMRHNANAKNQRITLEAKPLRATVNREQIWRVISNLIANAIKFSPDNSEIFVCLYDYEDRITIEVQDQGIGIPEHLRDSIWAAASPARRPGTAGEPSFGLGLHICKQIIETHKGRIYFYCPPEGGTSFFVDLPKAGKA